MSNLFKNNEAIVHQSNKGETTVFPKNSIWYKIGIDTNMVTFRSRYNDEVIFYENDVTELNINGELPENFVTEFNQIAYGGGKPEITDYDLLAVYNVTSTTSPTSLSYSTFLTSNILSMYIDDVEVAIGNAATFDSTGEHVVKYKLIDNTSIGYSAFSGCTSLTSINIPDSVTSIGNVAFENCKSLTSINIPNSVTSIGNYVFRGCSSLTSVTIGSGVNSIGNNTFDGCSGLTEVNITSIESWCNILFNGEYSTPLKYAKNLYLNGELVTDLVIPNSVTSIGNYAFYNCSGLTSIVIPNSVTSIGSYAFYACKSLTSITIPDSVTSFSTYTFYNCSSLTSITIPDSVTRIGTYTFDGCTSLTSATLGSGVTSIGDRVFGNCSGLTSINIPDSVTSIGNNTFNGCSGLTSVTLGSGVTSIGSQAFRNCKSLTSVTCNATTAPAISDSTFRDVASNGTLSFPCGSDYSSWLSTANYYLGKYNWSSECFSNEIDYDLLAVYNVTSTTSSTSLSYETALTANIEAMYIDNEQVEIGNAATFDEVGEHVVKYKLVDNRKIDNEAFLNCSALTEIVIPNTVTSIGFYTFQNCSGLTEIDIPNSVTSIASRAFQGCTSLSSIAVSELNEVYDSRDNCNAIIKTSTNELFIGCKNTIIPDGVTSIGDFAFYQCSGLTSINIPDGVTSIGNYAFEGCTILTEINIPSGVTSIGVAAFNGCSSLTEINIPNTVTSIGNSAFRNCSGLTEIVIPDSVTSIGSSVFHSCSGLTTVTIGDSVTSIGNAAFGGCTSLISATLGSGVTSIDTYAFYGCSGLTEIVIPDSVTSIGSNAFAQCKSLTSITCNATTAPTIGENTFNNVGTTGVLYYPCGSDYSSWINALDWSSECFSTEITDYTFSTTYNVQNINAPTQIFSTYKNYFQNVIEKMYVDDAEIPISSTYQFDSTGEHTVKFKLNGTNIPDYAFYDLLPSFTVDLKDITIIGMYAFAKSYLTGDLYIGDNITDINNGAFEQTYLTSVTVTPTFINSSSGLYKNSSRLISFTTNERIIGASDLEGCGSLTSVTAPNLVQIGQKAFARCVSLPSFTFPATVSVISNSAFTYCTGLTEVTFEMESLENIELGLDIFKDCTQHITIDYPCSVDYEVLLNYFEYYSTNCISDQYDIKAVYQVLTPNEEIVLFNEGEINFIPYLEKMYVDNVEIDLSTLIKVNESYQIGNRLVFAETGEHVVKYKLVDYCNFVENAAFFNITSLVSVILAKDFTSIGYNAFEQCVNLHTVKLPNSVEYIYNGAFYNCTSLTSVTLGEYVREIGWNAFERCQSMNYIEFKGTTAPTITSNSFADVATNGTIVHPCGYNYNAIRAALPNWYCECDLVEITDFDVLAAYDIDAESAGVETPIAFELTNISQIYINEVPVGVVSAYTFNQGQYVVKYKLVDSTTLKTVSGGTSFNRTLNGMFCSGKGSTLSFTVQSACTKMFGVAIMDGVTTIDQASFAGCTGLTEVIFPSTLTNVGKYAFQGCTTLDVVDIPSIETWCKISFDTANANPTYYTTKLYVDGELQTEITIPNSVTSINGYAFYSCSDLTSIVIPNTVTSIGSNAFRNCIGLTNITIPDSVTSIVNYAFAGCTNLTSATIGDSVTSITNYTFSGCSSLSSIVIPDSVTSIGVDAFNSCSSLISATIGSGVTSIANNAFEDCSGLTSITCNATTVPTIYENTFNNVGSNGTLYYPCDATGYDAWLSTEDNYLGKFGWTSICF